MAGEPQIPLLPPAPQRVQGQTNYPIIADTWAAAIGPWTVKVNESTVYINEKAVSANTSVVAAAESAGAAAESASSAADSATAATDNGAVQVELAAAQVELAAAQVGLATTQANNAAASANSAQVSAAAAGAAAGQPSLAGNAGKVLTVGPDATSVLWAEALPSIAGKAGQVLQVNQLGTAAQWVGRGILHVVDERASGVGAGGAGVGSYQTRVLNTVRVNTIAGASLASNSVTLPAGVYRIRASAPAWNVSYHKARLFNVTSSTVIAIGTNTQVFQVSVVTRTNVFSEITLSVPSVIRLEHRVQDNSSGGNTLGPPCSFGDGEVYSEMLVEKVA